MHPIVDNITLPISLVYLEKFSDGLGLILHGTSLYADHSVSDEAVAIMVSEMANARMYKLRAEKKAELGAEATAGMQGGFAYDDCFYSSTAEAQSDYIGLSDMSKTTLESYPIRCLMEDGVVQNKLHTPLEIKGVMTAGLTWKYTQMGKLGVLEAAVDAAPDEDAINAVVW